MAVDFDVVGALDWATGISSARQYKYQRKLQKHDQQFQREMSNTAHQREAADLKAAGLNPVLSAGGSGAMGTGASSGSIGMQDGAGNSKIDALELLTAKQTLKKAEKENDLIDAEIKKNEAETSLTKTENRNKSTTTPQMENDAKFAKTWWGRNVSPIIRDIFGNGAGQAVANTVTSARNANVMANAIKKTPHTHVHYH